jgi:hypothetical protein
MGFNTKMISSCLIHNLDDLGDPYVFEKKHIWFAKNKPNNPFQKKQKLDISSKCIEED